MTNELQRRAVGIARGWIGTPYHHQASVKGIGCDCLGLVRGVWRELYGSDPAHNANYTPDWGEANRVEAMLAGASLYMTQIELSDAVAGDVAIFRVRTGAVAKHAGIITTGATFIHAMEGCPVSEVAMSAWWRRRIAGVFRFPDPSQL
jgi:NlpC/P60 family putative phage cell wall peptidase